MRLALKLISFLQPAHPSVKIPIAVTVQLQLIAPHAFQVFKGTALVSAPALSVPYMAARPVYLHWLANLVWMVSPCLIQLFVKETVPLQQTNVQDALLQRFVLPVQSDFNFQPARPVVNHFAA